MRAPRASPVSSKGEGNGCDEASALGERLSPMEGTGEALLFLKCNLAWMTLVLLKTMSAPSGRSEGRERKCVSLMWPPS